MKQDGKKIRVGQCNNVFIFPGVGLGVLVSGAREVLPSFFTAAAKAVAGYMTQEDLDEGVLMPRVDKLKEVSTSVALEVGPCSNQGRSEWPLCIQQVQA